MAKDDRDILELLKFELNFLEQGGYGRSVRTPWKATTAFMDSISCINFGDPERHRPCDECLLMDFVPGEARQENVPCHHIPLNSKGETVDSVERYDNQQEVEDKLKQWLRDTIARLESERKRKERSA